MEKILVEINNISFHEQSNILSALGAKYAPCVLYKMRMVGIEESGINYSTPKISERGDLISKAKEMLHPKFK